MGFIKKQPPKPGDTPKPGKRSKLDPKPIGGTRRGWGTAGAGWVDVDPSGNRMNRRQAKKDDKEDAKWTTMTKKEYEEYIKSGGKVYGAEREGSNFRVKTQR